MNLSRWKVALSYVLVLAAGIATGVIWTKLEVKRGFENALRYQFWVDNSVASLQKELNLAPEQLPKVRALIEEGAAGVKTNLTKAAADSLAVLGDIGDRLDKELTPEQRAKHQRLRDQFHTWVRENWNIDPTRRPEAR